MNRDAKDNQECVHPCEARDGLYEIHPDKIERLVVIGEGGFGTVVKASHKDWGLLAVKYLKAENIGFTHAKKLREEAKIQARLTHPNIVQLIGIIWAPSNYAVVLEFMHHGALDEFCREYTPVPWQFKVKMVLDIVLGLNYLHTRKPSIIHQDLKIQNCLVGESFIVKLSDFGLSEWMVYSRQHTTHQPKGGTVTHLPPERWADINAKATFKFDVYSFGILLWEIVTERNPFEGKNDSEICHAVKNGQRPDLNAFNRFIPVFIIEMMKKCWDSSPEKRPTFGKIKEEIENFLEGNKLETDTARQQLFRQVSHNSSGMASGQYMDDPSLHVQFRSGDEVHEISVDENSQPDSHRPYMSGNGRGYNGYGRDHALQGLDHHQGVHTNAALPVQRVHTDDRRQPAGDYEHIPGRQMETADNCAVPIQRVATDHVYQVLTQPSNQRPLPEIPRDNSVNYNAATSRNINAGNYGACHTVDLAGERQFPDVANLNIGPPQSTATGSQTNPSINLDAGPSMNIRLDSTGSVNVTNHGATTSVPGGGSRIVINRTKTGGTGQAVQEHTVISGASGQTIQLGDRNVMNVHSRGAISLSMPDSSNKRSKVVIKKTITVSRVTVDHHAMDTVATHLGKHWKKLARELGFTDGQTDSFENDNATLYEQIYKMLHSWVQKTGPLATYKALAEALCNIKKGNVASLLQVFTQEN